MFCHPLFVGVVALPSQEKRRNQQTWGGFVLFLFLFLVLYNIINCLEILSIEIEFIYLFIHPFFKSLKLGAIQSVDIRNLIRAGIEKQHKGIHGIVPQTIGLNILTVTCSYGPSQSASPSRHVAKIWTKERILDRWMLWAQEAAKLNLCSSIGLEQTNKSRGRRRKNGANHFLRLGLMCVCVCALPTSLIKKIKIMIIERKDDSLYLCMFFGVTAFISFWGRNISPLIKNIIIFCPFLL